MSKEVIYSEIDQSQSYEDVWQLQKHLQSKLIQAKRSGDVTHPGYLLACEHPPVFTLGKSGEIDHLVASSDELAASGATFHRINRGGDITYHGPGQITVYPILDLDHYYHDLHRYVREIEEVVIRVISYYGLEGTRVPGYTGVWLSDRAGRRKICAIGVHMSRWVTMHGFALNVNTDLAFFNQIIPCGIQESDTSVTSISREVDEAVSLDEVRAYIKTECRGVFGMTFI